MDNSTCCGAINVPASESSSIQLVEGDCVTHQNNPDLKGTVREVDLSLPQPQIWVEWGNIEGREFNPPKSYQHQELTLVSRAMTTEEAFECLDRIATHLNSVRPLLLDMDERQGWKALGYTSMRQCLKAEMKGKLEKSLSYLYRELAAGQVEKVLIANRRQSSDRRIVANWRQFSGERIGDIPEGQLRELSKLTPEHWLPAWEEAIATAPPKGITASHLRTVVQRIKASTQTTTAAITSKAEEQASVMAVQSFFKTGDLVLIDCPQCSPPEYRQWNGCWGVVAHIGRSGSVELIVAGRRVRFVKHDLDPIDNPAPMLKEVASRVNQLLGIPDMDELHRQVLEFYVKRLTFTEQQMRMLEYMWSEYSEKLKPKQ